MRMTTRRPLLIALALANVLLAALCALYQATRAVPAFYRQALAAPAQNCQQQGELFEEHALALHNQLYQAGAWEVRFSHDEINAWLASELPAKFPQALPPGVSEPRVGIDGHVVRLAVHYQRGSVDTIISLAGDVWLTPQPNEIAVRIDQVRAGLVPVPLGRFLQEISQRAAQANVPLRWTEARGAPVAIVRLSLEGDKDQFRLVVQRLEIVGNELVVGGHTEEERLGEGAGPPARATVAQPGESETRQR